MDKPKPLAPVDQPAPAAMNPAIWDAPAANAADLAERINGLYAATWQIVRQCEAQLMEMLWELRHKHFTDADSSPTDTRSLDEQFQAFVKMRIPWLPPADAQRMVDTWNAARKDRGLLEFARNKPGEAMRFFPLLAAAEGGVDILPPDEGVAEILAMPTRKRNEKLRGLIDAADGGGARSAADEELIKSLTAERDELAATSQAGSDPDKNFKTLINYMGRFRRLADDFERLAGSETSEIIRTLGPGAARPPAKRLQGRIDDIRGMVSSLRADAEHMLEQWLEFADGGDGGD